MPIFLLFFETSSDEMKHVPELLQQYRTEKKYYQATELLMNSGWTNCQGLIYYEPKFILFSALQLPCWMGSCQTLKLWKSWGLSWDNRWRCGPINALNLQLIINSFSLQVFHVEVIDELQHRLYTKATGSAYKAPPTSAKKRTQNCESSIFLLSLCVSVKCLFVHSPLSIGGFKQQITSSQPFLLVQTITLILIITKSFYYIAFYSYEKWTDIFK